MAGIPASIKALAELSPVEDLIIALLRPGLAGIPVQTLINDNQAFPLVLVRRGDNFGNWGGDLRGFMDDAELIIHAFAEDPDGDEDAAILAEAVRVVLRDAWLSNTVIPGRGHLTGMKMTSPPRRVSDWATSTGPVQYADLPTGVHRYEIRFEVAIRKPRIQPFPL